MPACFPHWYFLGKGFQKVEKLKTKQNKKYPPIRRCFIHPTGGHSVPGPVLKDVFWDWFQQTEAA